MSWSISAEGFFYLLFPFVIMLLKGRSPRTLIVTAVSAWLIPVLLTALLNRSLPDVAFFLTYDFPPFRFGEFLVGVCLALWMRRGIQLPARISRAAVAGSGVFVAFVLVADVLHPIGRSYDSALFVPAVTVALFAAASSDLAGRPSLLHNAALVTLGQWSFALYLVHMLVIRTLAAVMGEGRPAYLPWWAAIIALLLSVALSGVAYEFVEKPAENRLRGIRRAPATLSS